MTTKNAHTAKNAETNYTKIFSQFIHLHRKIVYAHVGEGIKK